LLLGSESERRSESQIPLLAPREKPKKIKNKKKIEKRKTKLKYKYKMDVILFGIIIGIIVLFFGIVCFITIEGTCKRRNS